MGAAPPRAAGRGAALLRAGVALAAARSAPLRAASPRSPPSSEASGALRSALTARFSPRSAQQRSTQANKKRAVPNQVRAWGGRETPGRGGGARWGGGGWDPSAPPWGDLGSSAPRSGWDPPGSMLGALGSPVSPGRFGSRRLPGGAGRCEPHLGGAGIRRLRSGEIRDPPSPARRGWDAELLPGGFGICRVPCKARAPRSLPFPGGFGTRRRFVWLRPAGRGLCAPRLLRPPPPFPLVQAALRRIVTAPTVINRMSLFLLLFFCFSPSVPVLPAPLPPPSPLSAPSSRSPPPFLAP